MMKLKLIVFTLLSIGFPFLLPSIALGAYNNISFPAGTSVVMTGFSPNITVSISAGANLNNMVVNPTSIVFTLEKDGSGKSSVTVTSSGGNSLTNSAGIIQTCFGNTSSLFVNGPTSVGTFVVTVTPQTATYCPITAPPLGGGGTPAPAPATLHVAEQVSDGSATVPTFNLHVKLSGSEATRIPAVGTTASGISYSLSPGTYIVSEDANISYAQSFSGDCNSSGSVTLSSGDNKTCTITNTYIPSVSVSPVPDLTAVVNTSSSTPPQVSTPPQTQSPYVFTHYLRYGNKGDEVLNLQKILVQLGFLTTPPSGYYGPATRSAVKKFQKAHGLKPAGFVGPSTRDILNQL